MHLRRRWWNSCRTSCSSVPTRTAVRVTQLAEQLVEVPTIISYSSLQRTMDQHVDIPAPGRGGRNAGLQDFPPGQSSAATHSSETRISEWIVEQIVASPLSGGGLQSSSSSSHFHAGVHEGLDEPGAGGVFRTFPRGKKVQRSPARWVRTCPGMSVHGRRRPMRTWRPRTSRRSWRRTWSS